MFLGRWTSCRAASKSGTRSRFPLCLSLTGLLVSAGWLAGCGDSGSNLAASYANYEPSGACAQIPADADQPAVIPVVYQETVEPHLAALMPAADYLPAVHANRQQQVDPQLGPDAHWSFTTENLRLPGQPAALTQLPTFDRAGVRSLFDAPPMLSEDSLLEQPIGTLLPPRPIVPQPTEALVEATTDDIIEIQTESYAPSEFAEIAQQQMAAIPELAESAPLEQTVEPWPPEQPIAVVEPVATAPQAEFSITDNTAFEAESWAAIVASAPARHPLEGRPDWAEVSPIEQLTEVMSLREPTLGEQPESTEPLGEFPAVELTDVPTKARATTGKIPGKNPLPMLAELSDQQQLLASLLRESLSVTTGVLTDRRVDWEQRRERHHFQRFQVHHLMVAFALVHTTSILGTKCFCGVWRTSTLLPTFDWSASIASGLGG